MVNYLHDNAKYTETDENNIKNADILILQYIRDEVFKRQPNFEKYYKRGIINHEYIIDNLKKENAQVILIPHYTYNANLILDELIKGKVNQLEYDISFVQLYKEVNKILNNSLSINNELK
jgi:hypothetical protein